MGDTLCTGFWRCSVKEILYEPFRVFCVWNSSISLAHWALVWWAIWSIRVSSLYKKVCNNILSSFLNIFCFIFDFYLMFCIYMYHLHWLFLSVVFLYFRLLIYRFYCTYIKIISGIFVPVWIKVEFLHFKDSHLYKENVIYLVSVMGNHY